MTRFELVIAGGGLTAARAIRSYREAGGDGRIALLAGESVLPYHRPALSKKYLRGETGAPFVEDANFYAANDVEVVLAAPVTTVDTRARAAVTERGRFGFEKLLLATGAAPRRLDVPGVNLPGVHSLRTLHDSDGIREAAGDADQAVVVGGGFIGMEVAASLRALELPVTLVHMGWGLFDQLGSRALSEQLRELYRQNRVDVRLDEEVARFGGDGSLAWVETKSGLRLQADLAVVGVGVVPDLGYLADSGIAIENGILVDERYETNVPGVYAAGDVANFVDPLYGRRRRIEHWSNADYQGTDVGGILAGGEGGYDTLSSFFSGVFGHTLKVYGDTRYGEPLTAEGTLVDGFLAPYAEDGLLSGAITVGLDDETETRVKTLIEDRAPTAELTAEPAGARS